ncbi:hypothetical protein [Nocardioides ferulae]|uniref:hypothetical protein n=1 Tax=Nocardioides ferulae TaxID=2340821 RepID=UPI000F86E573|nr:hypothetical protein [Nocardioides ferulae]
MQTCVPAGKGALQTRIAAVAALLLGSLIAVVGSSPSQATMPGPSAAAPVVARGAGLSVSPLLYVGGQRLTFEGDLGRPGVAPLHLQSHMNRPGDTWLDVPGSNRTTNADGSFRFSFPAPSMFGISMRVVSGSAATPRWTFDAKTQDLTLSTHKLPGLPEGQVRAGVPFVIAVDTTPDLLRRPDLPGPIFGGRTLTLQQRLSDTRWKTLDTSRVDLLGQGRFVVTVDEPGTVVYRVRQEEYTSGGSEIGWYPSFPHYVRVVGTRPSDAAEPSRSTLAPAAPTTGAAMPSGPVSSRDGAPAAPGSASQNSQWRPALWDYAWVSGEALDSPPHRGTVRGGWWLDASDGSGRVSKHNGGLTLDSQRNYSGPGDHGSVSATLREAPRRYGRWESMMRLKVTEHDARDYHAVFELVPERSGSDRCSPRSILIADVVPGGRTVTMGATAANGTQWTRTVPTPTSTDIATTYAVELSKRHISWFANGRVVATLRNRDAIPGVPMTPRLSLVGEAGQEMNKTQYISDWQRGFSLKRGELTTDGAAMRLGHYDTGC